MIDTPLYLYGNTECPSPNDGALFHYTKFESFLKILETMTLRSSPLCKMNDLNEATIDSLDWNTDFLMMVKAQRYVKEECSVISFSKNYMTGSICEEGSNHPAMWAHYAQDSYGVCIVLDKSALLEKNENALSRVFNRFEPVEYTLHCAPDGKIVDKQYTDVSAFVQQNYHELFFKKHKDWAYEDEVRFLVESPEIYLDIKGAIKYIVLGGRLKLNSEKLRMIIEQFITPGTLSYHYFNLHSFAEILPTVNGYVTDGAAHIMLMELQKMSKKPSLAKDYLEWHDANYT